MQMGDCQFSFDPGLTVASTFEVDHHVQELKNIKCQPWSYTIIKMDLVKLWLMCQLAKAGN